MNLFSYLGAQEDFYLRLFQFFSHFREEEFHFLISSNICSGVEKKANPRSVRFCVLTFSKFFLSFLHRHHMKKRSLSAITFLFFLEHQRGEGEMPANNCQVAISKATHCLKSLQSVSTKNSDEGHRCEARKQYLGSTCSVYFSVWLKWLLLI